MGTNLADFIREAHRVLKDNGRVKIAEVRSRIEYSHSTTSSTKHNNNNKGNNNKYKNSKDNTSSKNKNENETIEGTLKEFIGVLDKLGFQCVTTDRSNTMFLLLDLKKNGKRPDRKLEFTAKPCIYKRR
jgi:ribosomal RNA-processing protein 8